MVWIVDKTNLKLSKDNGQSQNLEVKKSNFDAAFKDIVMVLRNDFGRILGAWTNNFASNNPYFVETEAALQAFKVAEEFGIAEAFFEGDTAITILAQQGLEECDDLKGHSFLSLGHHLLSNNRLWFANFSQELLISVLIS